MARLPCSVCAHALRHDIDAGITNGVTNRETSRKYGMSHVSVMKHKANHMGLAKQSTAWTVASRAAIHHAIGGSLAASSTVAEIQALRVRSDTLCKQAEVSGDSRTALLAIRELTRLLELQGRLTLEAQHGRASDISAHPVWQRLNSELATVLARHPIAEAEWKAVLERILGVRVTPDPGGTL